MNSQEIRNATINNTAVLVYFFNNGCAPCKVLRPKVQVLLETEFPEMQFILIDTENSPSTAAEYGVFSSPTIIVFFENKEYIRESKNISISELQSKIDRFYSMIY
jgi:thioredoxin-like negative regulator of GroEL